MSISIGGFISLAEQCLAEAAGVQLPAEEAKAEDTTAEDTTEADDTAAENADSAASGTVDGISGATISSTAAVTAINNAYSFLQTVSKKRRIQYMKLKYPAEAFALGIILFLPA